MVSYFKTQWFTLCVALAFLILAVVISFQPVLPDESVIERLDTSIETAFSSLICTISGVAWLTISVVNWHDECINELDKRIKALETVAGSNKSSLKTEQEC